MVISIKEVLEYAEVIVIGNKSEEFRTIEGMIQPDQHVLDLVRLWKRVPVRLNRYEGICW